MLSVLAITPTCGNRENQIIDAYCGIFESSPIIETRLTDFRGFYSVQFRVCFSLRRRPRELRLSCQRFLSFCSVL